MRFRIALALLVLSTSVPSARAELVWQGAGQGAATEESSAATRSTARFQRPSVAQRAKRVTPQEPAQLPTREAAPLAKQSQAQAPTGSQGGAGYVSQASHTNRTAARVRQARVMQASEESVMAPRPNAPSVMSSGPVYETQEVYDPTIEMHSGMAYGADCGCGDPSCGFAEPGCGFVEPGCGCVDGCCEMPSCGYPTDDCCCGEVGCGGACCDAPCLGGCAERGAIPLCIYIPPIKEFTAFGGVHGFKGPLDEYRDHGNFGFHEGFNMGGKMAWIPWPGLGYQVGYQAVHSQLHGSSENPLYDGSHTQHFLTAGLFRRSKVGFQYGVVYDMLRDERIESTSFHQVRGQISVINPKCHEIGFSFAASSDSEQLDGTIGTVTTTRTYQPIDQYLGFWKYHSCGGGEFSLYGGGGGGYGIFGGEVFAPLNDSWSLQTGFTYLSPGGSSATDAQEEGWNLGMNLVWHYGCSAKRFYKSPWRPMFNVADNGSFFVDDVD
ncbi:hypothetical protein Pla123a_30640 [Posidoniimonas polymericola]|uniref:Uncharacterized protein n=1 Tax=Posidoniimonas polymericola TaxID=2528002 RepID=A0A5C5YL32_9BACT|nr:DUF6666 family protein [Posidoniimonas polymericola]TWT75554.1 hypothetical protein Pla123a_30640 [Posidoniimonas polymericola]